MVKQFFYCCFRKTEFCRQTRVGEIPLRAKVRAQDLEDSQTAFALAFLTEPAKRLGDERAGLIGGKGFGVHSEVVLSGRAWNQVPAKAVARWAISVYSAVAVAILRLEDLFFYEWCTRHYVGRPIPDAVAAGREWGLLAASLMLIVLFALALWAERGSAIAAVVLAFVSLASYSLFGWTRVLAPRERQAWTSMLTR